MVIKTQRLLKVVRLTSTMLNSSGGIKCLKFNACSKLELDVSWTFYISLLIIYCIIEYVMNKRALNLEQQCYVLT